MKILHIINSGAAEGTPRIAIDFMELEEGQSYYLLNNDGPLCATFEKFGKPVEERLIRPKLVTGFLFAIQLARVIRKEEITGVINWHHSIALWVALATKISRNRSCVTHCGNPPVDGSLFHAAYHILNYGVANLMGHKIVCCSNYVRSQIEKSIPFYETKAVTIHNPINIERFYVNRKTSFKDNLIIDLVMVATLERHKNHELLLRSLAQTGCKNVRLNLVGDGSLRTYLQELVEKLGLSNVVFHGAVECVPDFLTQMHVFVMCTTAQEGFGTVLIEALAAGLPVIASDVPACREVLCGGKYGKIVSNTVQAWAAVLANLSDLQAPNGENNLTTYLGSFDRMRAWKNYRKLLE